MAASHPTGNTVTSRERMIIAMTGGKPDRVPAAPDISNMIPCRITGKPFWDIYMRGDPPLWRAYVDAVRYFGMDGWFTYGSVTFQRKGDQREWTSETISSTDERIVTRTTCRTPAGDVTCETTYYVADPPTQTRKWIKDFPADLMRLRHFFPEINAYDPAPLNEMRAYLGEDGALGACVGVPGFQDLFGWFDGGLEAVAFAWADHRDALREFVSWQERDALRQAEMLLDARPDFLLLGASGLWTLNTPDAFRELSLPTLKKVTRMAREAGVPTMLHSCGKERELVRICAEETDLDCINPLEPPPMGDCDLAEIKRGFGQRLALMGNLHTTTVMLLGTPETVTAAARDAIEAAGAGGGFILSTGDQCGRDTPDENIRAMVSPAAEYGRYD
jgi:uroporphyrinogen decarboxylase